MALLEDEKIRKRKHFLPEFKQRARQCFLDDSLGWGKILETLVSSHKEREIFEERKKQFKSSEGFAKNNSAPFSQNHQQE